MRKALALAVFLAACGGESRDFTALRVLETELSDEGTGATELSFVREQSVHEGR